MLLRRAFFVFCQWCFVSPGVFVRFVLGLRVFLRNILSGIIRRLILDGDIKGGREGEEST